VVAVGSTAVRGLLLRGEEALLDNAVEDNAAEDGAGGDDGRPDGLLDGEHECEHQLCNDETSHHLPVDNGPHLRPAQHSV